MLSPKKVKWRKQQKGRMKGAAHRGNTCTHGEIGIQALECGYITNRQIEAARIAMSRYTKRAGHVWIKIFPDKSLTKKPAEVRMGTGQGSPEKWVASVRAGRIMYEITGVERSAAKRALELAASKMPIRCAIVERKRTLM